MNELEIHYLSKISLKNYKSIQHLEINFHPGLNIIIGPNGSGKTNFVQALDNVLTERGHPELPIGFEFEFEWADNSTSLNPKWKGNIQELKHHALKSKKIRVYESSLEIGGKKIEKEGFFHKEIRRKLPFMEHAMLAFALPHELPYLKEKHYIKVLPIEMPFENEHFILNLYLEDEFGYFNEVALKLELHQRSNYDEDALETISKHIQVNDLLKRQLKRFSPIQDCRLARGYTVEYQNENFTIRDVSLEFWVNQQWCSWKQLSDGTKRLFYIISQTLDSPSFVLLEEPELGIHPDQLFRLMNFLRAQSETKQIILTTHSPDVLNILEKNELHKVVVTRFDKQKGTLMHHLSPEKLEKALRYIDTEGLELKDFWLHSNLEELNEAS